VNRFSSSFRFAWLAVIGVLLAGVSPSAAQQVSEARLKELMTQAQLLVRIRAGARPGASQAGSGLSST
jgi:type II secretory pathway pseudopilin PulG